MKKLIILLILTNITACSARLPKHNDANNFLPLSPRSNANNVIKTAKTLLGINYKYGGLSPKTGFDCSGFVYYTYKKQGVKLARTTAGQLKNVIRIKKSSLRPGDLVFFAINKITVSHVGIYLGNNKFIHSPSSGKNVKITSMNTNYWRSRFITGGRL